MKEMISHLPVQVGPGSSFAKLTVFSTGSRGYRATFKTVADIGSDEQDPREFQVSVLVTEVGSKGTENYDLFKKCASVEEYSVHKEAGTTPSGNGLSSAGAPRIAKS